MPQESSPPAPDGATPTTISRPMILALAEIHDEPVRIDGPRHINALTVKALRRRSLVVENARVLHITTIGEMVISAYCLAVDTIEARR